MPDSKVSKRVILGQGDNFHILLFCSCLSKSYESRVPATVGVEESYPVTKKQLELISNSNVIVKIDNPWPGLEKNSYAGQKGLWW